MLKYLLILICSLGSLAQAQFTPPGSADVKYQWYAAGDFADYVFLTTFRFISPSPRIPTLYLLDKNGDVAWYHQSSPWLLDFKIQANGKMSYNQNGQFYVLDSTFSLVDSFRCDGFNTDVHDFLLTQNDHAFLICTEDSIMDLSSIYTRGGLPGDTAALVVGNVIQELAPDKSSLRTWHTFDHFSINDSDSLFWATPTRMELNHTNSIDVDDHGQVLLSSRSNNELTMIDWASGDILWRLGGTQNQFTFPNDVGVSGQHDARFLPNNQISVFDNGNHHAIVRSRGLIYDIDTLNRVATKVWEYSRTVARSNSMGSMRVLSNGNRLINWGKFTPEMQPHVSLVGADSSLIMEMDFKDSYWTYRAQGVALPFTLNRPEIICTQQDSVVILSIAGNHASYMWSDFSTSPTLTVTDTGRYQVFVPMGIGMVGSNLLHISDFSNFCSGVGSTAESVAVQRRKLLGVFDILGRPVRTRKPGALYIEQYSDGYRRKVMWIE